MYSLNPYVYFFIQHLHVAEGPEDVGFYVGVFLAAFLAAQTIMAPIWGCFSDYIGVRKPFVLSGALGTATGFLLLGFSGNFPMVPQVLFALTVGSCRPDIHRGLQQLQRDSSCCHWRSHG